MEHFKNELKNIRTGRANPGILDSVTVELYGSQLRLKELASVTAPEARMLLITPFEGRNSGTIGKAIEKANIGLQPIVDGNVVRIKIPTMDESMRKDMIKVCNKKREECKVGIRNVRHDLIKLLKRLKESAQLPEDEVKKFEKKLQELTDKFCKEADEAAEKKEKEISTI